jgi:hypothetical protein
MGITPSEWGGDSDERDEGHGDIERQPQNSTVRRARLLNLRANVVLSPTLAHVLHGYTPTFGQYWQYESASEAAVRETRVEMPASGELFEAAQAFPPVGFVLQMLCERGGDTLIPEGVSEGMDEETAGGGGVRKGISGEGEDGGGGNGGAWAAGERRNTSGGGGSRFHIPPSPSPPPDVFVFPSSRVVTCSRATAARRLASFRAHPWLLRSLEGAWGLHSLFFSAGVLTFGVGRQLVYTLPVFALLHVPAVYFGMNLLRHVDTPATPLQVAAAMAAYASTWLWVTEEVAAWGGAAWGGAAWGGAVGQAGAEGMRDAGVLCEGPSGGEEATGVHEASVGGASAGSPGADGAAAGQGAVGGREITGSRQLRSPVDAQPSGRETSALRVLEGALEASSVPEEALEASSVPAGALETLRVPEGALDTLRVPEGVLEAGHPAGAAGADTCGEKNVHSAGVDVHTVAASLNAQTAEAASALYPHRPAEVEALRQVERALEVGGVVAANAGAALVEERGMRREAGGLGGDEAGHAVDVGEGYRRGSPGDGFSTGGAPDAVPGLEGRPMAPAVEPGAPASHAVVKGGEELFLIERLELHLFKASAGQKLGVSIHSGPSEMPFHPSTWAGAAGLHAGARVTKVEPGSLGERAGVRLNDWVLSVNGISVVGVEDAGKLMRGAVQLHLLIDRPTPAFAAAFERRAARRAREALLDAALLQLRFACSWAEQATTVPVMLLVGFCCYLRTHLGAREREEEQVSSSRGGFPG